MKAIVAANADKCSGTDARFLATRIMLGEPSVAPDYVAACR